MREIPLTKGHVAMVDDDDFDKVSVLNWTVKTSPNRRTKYASTTVRGHGIKKQHILMHRFIVGCDSGIDHRDGDGLNNQRSNLRQATQSQNMANTPKRLGLHTSPYKGVAWRKDHKKWRASIKCRQKDIHLGYFMHDYDAALAYNLAAYELFGEFARLNKPCSP